MRFMEFKRYGSIPDNAWLTNLSTCRYNNLRPFIFSLADDLVDNRVDDRVPERQNNNGQS